LNDLSSLFSQSLFSPLIENRTFAAHLLKRIMLKEFLSRRDISFEVTPEGIHHVMGEDPGGTKPEDGQYVKVHYTGTLLDGKKFDSSRDRDQPFVFQVGGQQVIQGWDLGLKLFSVGQSGTLYLPPELAYGSRGAGEDIPPNAALKFDIELLEILDEEAYKAHQIEEEKRQREMIEAFIERQMKIDLEIIRNYTQEKGLLFRHTQSGLHYMIEKEGGLKPQKGQNVSVHYTGKLLNGQVFDSSIQRGEPISFPIGEQRVIPGWDEGIALFGEGGKGTLLIPSIMAYGPRAMGPIPANSILLFEIELVKVG
jgi:peptidylprolyl isomerase